MKMDFNSVGHLARTAFDFVREQSKRSASGFAQTATRLFNGLKQLAGFREKSVTNTFSFSDSRTQAAPDLRSFDEVPPPSLSRANSLPSDFRAFEISPEFKNALRNGIANGQGLIVSGTEQRAELGELARHLKTVDSFDLGDGLCIRSIEDSEAHTEDGQGCSTRSLWASVSDGRIQETLEVAVTEAAEDAAEKAEVLEFHLARSASLDRGLDEQLLPGVHSPSRDKLKSLMKETIRQIRSPSGPPVSRTQSAPDLLSLEKVSSPSLRRVHSIPANMQAASVPRGSGSSSPSLTLVGKQPATVGGNWAYVQPQQRTNHCGVMAVNGFFQAQVIQPGDLVRGVIARDPALEEHNCEAYGGAFHPKLINSFRQGDADVEISRQAFEQGQHRRFIEDKKQVPNENVPNENVPNENVPNENVQYKYEDSDFAYQWGRLGGGPGAQPLKINPGHWLSARGGAEIEPMVEVINQLLKTRTAEASDPWHNYPAQVAPCFLREEAGGNRQIFSEKLQNSMVDRMVCFTDSPKHWFALVKSGDKWLRLDNDECGLPKNKRGPEWGQFCEVDQNKRVSNAQLKEQLKKWGVSEVICDKACADAYSTALQNLPS